MYTQKSIIITSGSTAMRNAQHRTDAERKETENVYEHTANQQLQYDEGMIF